MTIQDQIVAAASAAGVDPNLALGVAQRESGFNQDARGAAGEIGVFQLMPATASGLGVDPYDLAGNIAGGVRYLAQNLAAFGGDPFKALAAYNAGPGAVGNAVSVYGDGWFDHIPASTQTYVTAIMDAQPGTEVYAGVPGTLPPINAATVQPLAMGVGLAAALLLGFAYVSANPRPELEDLEDLLLWR